MGEKITLERTELESLLRSAGEAAAKAALDAAAGKKPEPTDLEDNFRVAERLRDKAEARARPHQWRAFLTHGHAIGVAYILSSRTHPTGRVIKFEHYEIPPAEMRGDHPEPEFHIDPKTRTQVPNKLYPQWVYATYRLPDMRSYVGVDASLLPNVQPPRKTLEDALKDVEILRARREEFFAKRPDPQQLGPDMPLPAVVG